MVQAKNILDRSAQFQWDSDSNCKSTNCRPTSEAMIAGYYKDTHISPNSMRQAMGYSSCGGTDTVHGVAGLQHFGVTASWGQLTSAQVISKVNQNIPVDLAVLYSKIPRSYVQDTGFYGLHSVVACKRALSGTTYGLFVRDPDRWGTGQVDHVFWPDSIWIPAFAGSNYVAVWPNNTKVITVATAANYKLTIAANTNVMFASLGTGGCISGWSYYKWGPTASAAPAQAPIVRKGCSSGSATTAYVTAGVFAGKHVRIGNGTNIVKI